MFVVIRPKIKTDIIRDIVVAGILLLLLGLLVSRIAMYISIKGILPEMPNVKCDMGAVVFCFFGYLVNLVGIPVLGLIFYIQENRKQV